MQAESCILFFLEECLQDYMLPCMKFKKEIKLLFIY